MSSCAASCSTCCHPALCASATSGSSQTGNAPSCCRSAVSCSAARRERQLRRLNHLSKGLTHSGTARSAEAPCASSNGSPPPNSCFAHHRNQTSAQHEALSISPAFARASARLRIPCLIRPKTLKCQSLKPPHQPPASRYTAPSGHQTNGSHPTRPVPDPSAPAEAQSKYIGFHGGRLPSSRCIRSALPKCVQRPTLAQGAPDTALRLMRTNDVGTATFAGGGSRRSSPQSVKAI